ncbi:MAG: DNA-processing protein DprA [Candidatus Tumulicola sp.]
MYESRERIEAARGGRSGEAAVPGLWRVGTLAGLGLPCVAIVGTRAATPLGKFLAREFAAQLGRAGCCILSGLALGIDAAAHEGALDAGAATVGVLGGGHRNFFPARNRALAARMVAAGGAVLSPFSPECRAYPWQFLARNGVVAALADAVVVIEAPARSGALNTAGWAAGHIPVLAVPGDVDRKHVQGCLALIRDGAVLARSADDVLEALGRAAPAPFARLPARAGPHGSALLAALDAGVSRLDDLVAATGIGVPAALAALAILELDGLVECRAASTYARNPLG